MNEDLLMQWGVPLLSLAAGWLARHYNLGGIRPAPVTPATPSPVVPLATPDERLARVETLLASLLAAFTKPPTPAAPTS